MGKLQNLKTKVMAKRIELTEEELAARRVKDNMRKIWTGMKQRCNNPNNSNYHNYGGRGIKVCLRWEKFENFFEDMGERPPETSIDRIDNNADYSPENCRWTNKYQQAANTRNTVFLTHEGKTMCLTDWAWEKNIHWSTLSNRIFKLGWTTEKALDTPVRGSNPCDWRNT